MRILVTSYAFAPSIGGVETMSENMARTFTDLGHEVTVLTDTPHAGKDDYPFRVIRCPDREVLKAEIRATDVVWQNNVSLRLGWPLLVMHKPTVITHNGPQIARSPWKPSVLIQRILCRRSYNVGASKFMAALVPGTREAVDNPFSNDFRLIEGIERNRDVAFVGRVVSEKGPDLLIAALNRLKDAGQPVTATIIGDGDRRASLEQEAGRLGLDVRFTGSLPPPAIARELNSHHALAVPSVWEEPFGIVALEGLACGCRVVASNRGGLPDAAGPGAVLFDVTNPPTEAAAAALADALLQALRASPTVEESAAIKAHLEAHSADAIAERYLTLFQRQIEASKR